jgi:anti-sigma-K factor RskA
MERSHEELKELLVPYALGAVPPEEMAEIRSHILTCEECMAEADSFAEVASTLAVAADEEPVPAGFADRVIDLARDGRSVEPARPMRSRRWRLVEALSFAALVLAVAVLGFAVVNARSDAAFERRVAAALVDGDGLQLTGQEGVGASVVSTGDETVFVAAGLEEVESSETYQLWLMKGDCGSADSADCTIESGGTFEPGDDGVVFHEASQPLDAYDDAAVTIEPEGGSEQPTSDPLISSLG